MAARVRALEEYKEALWAVSCPIEDAVRWLQTRAVEHSTVYGSPQTPKSAHLPEYLLWRRHEPAIDLALAEHGRSRSVLDRLWDHGGDAMRVILAGNPSLFVGDYHGTFEGRRGVIMDRILRECPSAQLRAFCRIPDLHSGFYEVMIHAWQPDRIATENRVSEERFREILTYLAENPRSGLRREDSHERLYLDGYSEYQYNVFFIEAWRLAQKVEVTPEWAAALATLYGKLHHPYCPFDDVEAVVARWRVPDEQSHGPTQMIRKALAVAFMKPTVEMARSDDPAMRWAFYESFDPDAQELRDIDWSEFLERDDYPHFDLQNNDKIWRSARGRRRLEQLLWHASKKDNDLVFVGFFKEMEGRYRREHPEWFVEPDDEGEIVEPQPDKVDMLQAEIARLIERMAAERIKAWVIAVVFVVGILAGHWR